MASAARVCRSCGKDLSPGAKFCSHCGTQFGATTEDSNTPQTSTVTCTSCGHVNTHEETHCEACGAKLPGRAFQESRTPTSRSKKSHPTKKEAGRFTFEPWHYIVAALALAVIGVFIYSESQRAHPPAVSQQQETPKALEAIERLETLVKENPNDVGSKLLLANALHDASMHDLRYLQRAIDAYITYLKIKPDDPNARVDLGICYFELGKIDSTNSAALLRRAIHEMEAAVKGSPNHQAGAFNLGIVQLFSGNFQESNRWFKKAIELNPESDLGKRAKTILEQHSQPM